jgi:hypothetical protein
MRFARWLFLLAGVYGVLLITPMFFLEGEINSRYPPAIEHPEFFYGFLGACLAWQFMYLLIGMDPHRYRPPMLLAATAKMSVVLAAAVLYVLGRVPTLAVALVAPDGLLAIGFVAAWFASGEPSSKTSD